MTGTRKLIKGMLRETLRSLKLLARMCCAVLRGTTTTRSTSAVLTATTTNLGPVTTTSVCGWPGQLLFSFLTFLPFALFFAKFSASTKFFLHIFWKYGIIYLRVNYSGVNYVCE